MKTSGGRYRHNLAKLYLFAFFQTFLVIIPVIVPYWQAKGLTLAEVFSLQGLFGLALILFDAPAGYLADVFGRKASLIVGSLITALGFQILWFGQTFLHFAIYEFVLGLGLSLQSGCDIAILYGTLEKLQLGGRKAGYLGRRMTASTTGEGVASLLGGFLAGYSLNWPAIATALACWMPVLIALTLEEPEGQKLSRTSHLENFRSIGKALFGHSRVLTFVILSFIFYGFATYCAVWSFQPYWQARGLSVSMFGYLWATNCFVIAIVSRYAHAIEERIGSSASIVIIALLPVIGYLGMGYLGGLTGLAFGVAFPLCRGLSGVLFQDAINSRVPAEMRATTNSIGSLGMRALFLVFGPLIGHVLDQHGPEAVMKVLGGVFAAGFFMIAWPLLAEHRHFRRD